ncbi:MAG: hypothetical protein QOJ02_1119 [Acidobacteriota bacterium]|jgi:hypothetical protein|nr:hypothetical protein [Acidobacteriota bacterium]
MNIPAEAIEEARRNPNGYVYMIDGKYEPDEFIPKEAIVGAWKVDERGNITGEFISNPTYKPVIRKTEAS